MEFIMKALIVLENHFYKDRNGKIWCDRIIDYKFLSRYLEVFDNIVVAGRCQKIENNNDNKLLVSGKNLEFVELPEFVGAQGLLKNLYIIKKIMRKSAKKTDCVIFRAPTHLSLFTYKEVLKENKILVLEFMMAADKMFDGNGWINKILNRIIDNEAKKMCLKANGVSYVTEKILQEKYPCQAILDKRDQRYFTANYSTIDLPKAVYYKQKWKEEEVPNIFNIIHIGYMDSYRKGQHTLLKAIKLVKEKGIAINVTLVGDGDKRSDFEKLAKDLKIDDIVKFEGAIKDRNTILKLLRESHLFVFPTQSEGLPRTIIEAMSQGLPCVASPVDGIPELLEKEFLIDYSDSNEYANKIIEILSDWKNMIKISNENYLKSQKYESKRLMSERTRFYERIRNGVIENENSVCGK